MEFNSAIYCAIVLSFLSAYLFWSKSATSKKSPPHAGGTRFITGHLHLVRGGPSDGLPHLNLSTLADTHGPAFTIQLGVRRALVLTSHEFARHVTATVSPRLTTKAATYLGLAHELRSLPRMTKVCSSETAQFISDLYKVWDERKDVSGPVRVDLNRMIVDFGLNVVLRAVVGKRLNGGEERWREVTGEMFCLAGMVVVGDAFPHFGWLDVGGYEKRMKETSVEIGEMIGGWLAEYRRKEYSGEEMPPYFMDVMSEVEDECQADAILKATCQALIGSWSNTIILMLVRTLSLLVQSINTRVLKNARRELDEHVGTERRVMESDIKNLVYLQAILKETWRLYPPTSLDGPREFTKNCDVGGYHISKGMLLIVNSWKLQRDSCRDDNPLEFRPERFLTKDENSYKLISDQTLIWDPKSCPEINLCLHLALANMLQAFEFWSEQINDMAEGDGIMMSKDHMPLEVFVAPRLSLRLYFD